MKTASVGNNFHLLDRYPELLFLLSYTPSAFTDKKPDDNVEFLSQLDLEKIDILYQFGIGSGRAFVALKGWLKERRERRLIFIEDDLNAVHSLLQCEHAEELLAEPQVVIHFVAEPRQMQRHLEELASTYSCDRIEVAAIESYQKKKRRRFYQIRLKLFRLCAVYHAILTESLYAHKMLVNVMQNIRRWPGCFLAGGLKGKFRNIPAVICGAGPSLQAGLSQLKQLEDKALIIAGGSTIAALSNQGVQPHLGVALDPNAEEFGRLKISSSYETPLIYGTRLQPDVFNAINGERGYLVSDTGGPCERYFEKQLGIDSEPVGPELGPEALSVTTLAIALAVEMGCNPILLDGIDLAYTGLQRYADGILPSSYIDRREKRKDPKSPERLLKRKDIHGNFVSTLVKWVMESECIASYAKAHPDVRFLNVSSGGIGFPGIQNVSFEETAKEFQTSLDLRALVHAEIQKLKVPLSKEKIRFGMKEIGESLIRLGSIAGEMIEEIERVRERVIFGQVALPTGKMAILEIDFQEEKAFECLFPTLGPALDKLLARAFYCSSNSTEEEKRRIALESKLAKWRHWKEMIDNDIALFQ